MKCFNKRTVYVEPLEKAIVFLKKPICFFFSGRPSPYWRCRNILKKTSWRADPGCPCPRLGQNRFLATGWNRFWATGWNRSWATGWNRFWTDPAATSWCIPAPRLSRWDPILRYGIGTLLHEFTCDFLAFFSPHPYESALNFPWIWIWMCSRLGSRSRF